MAAPASTPAPVPTFQQLVDLASQLAEADERLLYELIQARKDADLSQRELAKRLGISQPAVAKFERHDSDPRLSTVRRYALAVGAIVEHSVNPHTFGGDWTPMPNAAVSSIGVAAVSTQHVRFKTAANSNLTDFDLAA
jgi:transcriptional regulator with XRE-family HTH domain